MQWLIFSLIFRPKAKLMITVESLEREVDGQKSQIQTLTAKNEELLIKEKAYERMKEVFIKHGDSFFFAEYTTKNRFAIVGLDREKKEIKVWGEYSETEPQYLPEDCKLEYKFRSWEDEPCIYIDYVFSGTKEQGYADLAVKALAKIAKEHDLKIISGILPREPGNGWRIEIYRRMGFTMMLNDDNDTGSFYKRI
jgi:hypothetical protein